MTSLTGLYVSLLLFIVSALIILYGEIKHGKIKFWGIDGRLQVSFHHPSNGGINGDSSSVLQQCGSISHTQRSNVDNEHEDNREDADAIFKSQQFSDDITNEAQELKNMIDQKRFNLSSVILELPPSLAVQMSMDKDHNVILQNVTMTTVDFDGLITRGVVHYSGRNESIIQKIASKRKPQVLQFQSKDTINSNTQNWNLWELAKHWQVLKNVHSLETKKKETLTFKGNAGSISNDHVFVVEDNIKYEHILIHPEQCNPIDSDECVEILPINPSSRSDYMNLVDFLVDSKENNVLKHLFVCGGEDFEKLDKVVRPENKTDPGSFTKEKTLNQNGIQYPDFIKRLIQFDLEIEDKKKWWNLLQFQDYVPTNITSGYDNDYNIFSQPVPELVMLSPGAALQTRYSSYHTIRTQLSGSTRYTLFSSEVLHQLKLFPSIHSAKGQSQINMNKLYNGKYDDIPITCETKTMPKKKKSCIYSIVLLPNQALYIPPYWSVYTEAISDGKSIHGGGITSYIDIHSISMEQLVLAEADHMVIPIHTTTRNNKGRKKEGINNSSSHSAWRHLKNTNDKSPIEQQLTMNERVISSQMYIVHILVRIMMRIEMKELQFSIENLKQLVFNPSNFSERLYINRYNSIFQKDSYFLTKGRNEFKCYKNEHDEEQHIKDILSKLDHEIVKLHIQFIVDCLNDPILTHSLRIVWLQEYIEKIARWAMGGDSLQAIFFILQCIDQDDLYIKNLIGHINKEIKPEEEKGPNVLKIN